MSSASIVVQTKITIIRTDGIHIPSIFIFNQTPDSMYMMKTRNKATPAAYLFLMKEGKILLARRANTGYEDGKYQVPAGHVEEGESPSVALMREAKEEIGIDVHPDDLKLVHISYRPKHDETGDRVDFFFTVDRWSGDVKNMEPHKCDDLIWVPVTEIVQPMTLHVRKAIESMNKKLFFEEIALDELKAHGLYRL